jgi:hypothetical protein
MEDVENYRKYLLHKVISQYKDIGKFKKWLQSIQPGYDMYAEVFETNQGTFILFGADYIGGDDMEMIKSELEGELFKLRFSKFISLKNPTAERKYVLKSSKKEPPYLYKQYEDDEFALVRV